jgi:superfamily II DNA or RNA helicase
MKLEEIVSGQSLAGIEPSGVLVSVVATVAIAEGTVRLIYQTPDGVLKERLLGRADEAAIALPTSQRPWSFDGDPEAFQLACEAKRIDLAFLFDPMMAVHTSNVQPLPHQITAVYESMLPRQPLRFLLADDPGAGKTIMAGLYIRELVMRADARRVLIVAPGSLVEQWRDELHEKFGLEFKVFTSEMAASAPDGNPFDHNPFLIVRLDQLSRDEVEAPNGDRAPGPLQTKVMAAGWDLIIFDEAHKLAAHYNGGTLSRTARFRLAERLGGGNVTRHLLLMTATPHNGKEADFQLFLSLLDGDRFYGRFRGDGVHKVDSSDLMRRMIKEELVKFDGTPLFPERKAYTVNYILSDLESALYHAVTAYVQEQMGKADELDGTRKVSVGFALTALQRRLASSPEAIYQSLKRRRERLEARLRDEKLNARGRRALAEVLQDLPEDDDDLDANEQENLEEKLVDQASAANTIAELEIEIETLHKVEGQARAVVTSGQDRKWEELSRILQNDPSMKDQAGRRRKLIIFTEHRDTLNYLHGKISGVIGNPEAVITIHGGTNRDERRRLQGLFRTDPEVLVLVATDAAGEGVNLQNANLMVNYDLPWNPNRLEQRFGRIHRIGQTEVCHLWNLVAKETREGEVYHRLLKKLEIESEALKGRVFDILGEVFEETRLKDLLMQAIRYGDQPEVRARLSKKIDDALDHEQLKRLLDQNALDPVTMTAERLYAVKAEMEKAEARRLQPFFVRSYFLKAFQHLKGTIHPREAGRHQITHVPTEIRERDRLITGRNRRNTEPVFKQYERVCFEKQAIQPLDRPGARQADLLHPGHPLMLSVTDLILDQAANLLRQGAVLIDPHNSEPDPWLLFLLTHEIKAHDGTVISKRMQFIRVRADGSTHFAGYAPHLDLEPATEADRALLAEVLTAPWLNASLEQRAVALAASALVPEHFAEINDRRTTHVTKTLNAVHERLTNEIKFWSDRWMRLDEDKQAGKDVRLQLDKVSRTINDLQGRLDHRRRELETMRHIVNGTPVVLGGALVVPAQILKAKRGDAGATAPDAFAADAKARAKIERLAMEAVRRHQESQGCTVNDVSEAKCGWDLTSFPPMQNGKVPDARHIEVKGRVAGANTVTVTRNEMLYALNQGEKFVLAIVQVKEDDSVDGPYYIRNPFDREPPWGASSVNFDLADLLSKAAR